MKQKSKSAPGKLKLAAIDLDGTLLGPDLEISKENQDAVVRLQQAGVETVLASGRHYESMKPFADRVGGINWIVSVQGGEIADVSRKLILSRLFLDPSEAQRVTDLARELNFASILYAPEGVYTDSSHGEEMEFYAHLTKRQPLHTRTRDLPLSTVHKIVWIGDSDRISQLTTVEEVDGLAVQKVHTHLRLFEFMPHNVDKGAGLDVLARHLGILPGEVVSFGDAENDISMFKWAGHSVAMNHGWPGAIKAAAHVTPEGPPDTAFARAVDHVLGGER